MSEPKDNSVVAVVLRSMHRKTDGVKGMTEHYICPKCGKPYHSYKKGEEDHSIVDCWETHLEQDHHDVGAETSAMVNDPPLETDEE